MSAKLIARSILLTLVGGVAWLWFSGRTIHHPPGVLLPDPPVQKDIVQKPLPDVKGWSLTAVAEYRLRARVLDTRRYRTGRDAALVPVDVAVGWGRMSDEAVLDRLSLSMSNRFFFYEWPDRPPIPQDEIERSAANNHVISANGTVRRVIASLRPGHILTMKGYLVNARGPDGGNWSTSLRRDDTGKGACELFYVESASAATSPDDGF